LICGLLIAAAASPVAMGQRSDRASTKKAAAKEERKKREASLRKIAEHLGIGSGSAIADIGAGDGPDTWLFAQIVGETGRVYAEEIAEAKTKAIQQEASRRQLSQVTTVLGKPDDPMLPGAAVDMAFMHLVYHHLSEPRKMLQGIWRSLKPGGYYVVVDQRRGTLADWVPRQERAGKHYWIAETTVVREAREQGFRFVECAESYWYSKDPFVLIFQRPVQFDGPNGDPDPLPPLAEGTVSSFQLPTCQHAAFVALGEGRKLIKPILAATSATATDIVLEEWATQKDERPESPGGVELPAVLTEKGDPHLDTALDAVFFLDSYHLLFHAPTLLGKLQERLAASGCVYVLDRKASGELSRREASHRRMIAPSSVIDEMQRAGFRLLREEPLQANERFLLVFKKT